MGMKPPLIVCCLVHEAQYCSRLAESCADWLRMIGTESLERHRISDSGVRKRLVM